MSALVTQLPEFARGPQFQELSPAEGHYRLRYVFRRHVRIRCKGMVSPGEVISFRDKHSREWFRIDDFGFLIAEGYAWNGCSPKKWIFPFGWCGTLDFEETILPSGLHDAFYQFHATQHFPMHRSECDQIFKEMIELGGRYKTAATYHYFVRKCGKWNGQCPDGIHSVLL